MTMIAQESPQSTDSETSSEKETSNSSSASQKLQMTDSAESEPDQEYMDISRLFMVNLKEEDSLFNESPEEEETRTDKPKIP